jgi:hypothetical protein
MQADIIALINANAVPLPANARDGAVITYSQVQYNGANIRAANVPPPTWLNIDPKMVNKLATEREVIRAAAQIPPVLPQQIVNAVAAVSVVSPEATATVVAVTAAAPGATVASVLAAVAPRASVAAATAAAVPGATIANVCIAVVAAVPGTNVVDAATTAAALPTATLASVVAAVAAAASGTNAVNVAVTTAAAIPGATIADIVRAAAGVAPGVIVASVAATTAAALPAATATSVATAVAAAAPGTNAANVAAAAATAAATTADVVAAVAGEEAVAFNPRLPAVLAAAGAAPAKSLQALLRDGEWGNALIGLVQDIRTPIPITIASIDSIFKWGKSVSAVIPAGAAGGTLSRRDSYAQAIANLLQLPSGVRLFRDIIIACHCLPNLSKVRFQSTGKESSASYCRYGHSCKINLQWNNVTGVHVGSGDVYIATNSHVAAPVGAAYPGKGSQVDFVNAQIPPSLVLSHELNHYLRDLIALKTIVDNLEVDKASMAILEPFSPQNNTCYGEIMSSISWGVRHIYPKCGYQDILRKIIPDLESNTLAEKAFVDLWDNAEYAEMVNILPIANILSSGDSSYSEGVMAGEAYTGFLPPHPPPQGLQVNFTRNNAALAPGGALSAESFIRFGLHSSISFWEVLDDLIVGAAGDQAIGIAIRDAVRVIGTNEVNLDPNAITNAGTNVAVVAAAGGNALVAAAAATAVNAALAEFKDLVQRLLDTITVNGQNLWAGNNNLPRF